MNKFKGWSYDGIQLESLGFFLTNKNLGLTPGIVAGEISVDDLAGTIRQESIYGAREFELTGVLVYPDSDEHPIEYINQRKVTAQRALSRLFKPLDDRSLVYGFAPDRYMMCQRIGDIQRKDFINHSDITIKMLAQDPFFYELPLAIEVGNEAVVEVPGNMVADTKFTVYGSVAGNRVAEPYIEVNGLRAKLDTAIGRGDTLIIDSHRRFSAYNGTQPVGFNDVYPALKPGSNIITTNLEDIIIDYRPCWLT